MTFIESLLYWLMLMSQPNVDGTPGVHTPDRNDRDAKEQSDQEYRDDGEQCGCEEDGSARIVITAKKKYGPVWGRISNGL